MKVTKGILQKETVCPNCHKLEPLVAIFGKFCPSCGAKLQERETTVGREVCSNCGRRIITDYPYCIDCGEKLC